MWEIGLFWRNLYFVQILLKNWFHRKKPCSMWFLHVESVQKIHTSDKYLHVVATTCRKIGPRTINPLNTKSFFSGISFYIHFSKSQEISAKLNDSVKNYNRNTNRGRIPVTFPCRNRVNNVIYIWLSLSYCEIVRCIGWSFLSKIGWACFQVVWCFTNN